VEKNGVESGKSSPFHQDSKCTLIFAGGLSDRELQFVHDFSAGGAPLAGCFNCEQTLKDFGKLNTKRYPNIYI